MKKLVPIAIAGILLTILMASGLSAQVGIGTTSPNSSSILELSATDKGLLIPRLSTTQRNSIVSPATGLQVYNLDDGCTDTYDGANWMKNCSMKQTGTGDSTGTNQWVKKADFANGLKRSLGVGFSIGSKGYLGTGYEAGQRFNDFWEYSPTANTWTQKANVGGGGREAAVGFGIGSKGYIGTGLNSSLTALSDFWEYDPVANTWTQKANYGGPARSQATAFVVNGNGYVGTGYGTNYLSDFWMFDPVVNSWAPKANLPGLARQAATGFNIGNKGYVGAGNNSTHQGDFYEYDPVANTWTQKANVPGSPRRSASGVGIGNKGYLGLGLASVGGYLSDLWEYDAIANTWIAKLDFPGSKRARAAGFALNNKFYVGTGGNNSVNTSDFWEYTPSVSAPIYAQSLPSGGISSMSDGAWTLKNNQVFNSNSGSVGIGTSTPNGSALLELNSTTSGLLLPRMTSAQRDAIASPVAGLMVFNLTDGCTDTYDGTGWAKNCAMQQTGTGDSTGTNFWTRKADFANGLRRENAVGFSIGTKGYIGTGSEISTYYNDFWEYNPASNAWTQKANFGGTARHGAFAFALSTKGYVGGGNNAGVYSSDMWEYNPATNTWTQKGNYGGGLRSGAVAMAINGKGYVGTGKNATTYFNDFWEYDGLTNIWTSKASLPGMARNGAIAFSISNKGYLGSGQNGVTYYDDFYEYNAVSNTWATKANLPGDLRYEAVGFGIGAKGYFGTGSNNSSFLLSDFWEYDPALNTWAQRADFGGGKRANAVGFSIGDIGYLGTGEYYVSSGHSTDFWEYKVPVSAPIYALPTPSGGIAEVNDGAWTLKQNQVFNSNSGNVGIGTNAPNTSAQLEVASTTSGFLMPRMTTTHREAILSPATGLLVYDLSDGAIWVYDGNVWNTLFKNHVGVNYSNVAIGRNALDANLNGDNYNTAIGISALEATNGTYNTALGTNTGTLTTTGDYNTFIGTSSGVATGGGAFNNMTALGYSAKTAASNTIRLGNSSITDVEAYAPYTDISDGRFKRDVKANVPGLEFIRRLRPVTYHLDVNAISEQLQEDYQPDSTGQLIKIDPDAFTRSSRQQKSTVLNTGFIAQEVEAAAREIGFDFFGVDKPKNEQDFYGLRYAQFTVPLVRAVQELESQNETLNTQCKALDERNTALENQNKSLMADIAQLKAALNAQTEAHKVQEDALNLVKQQVEALTIGLKKEK